MHSVLQKVFGRMDEASDETLEGIKEVIFFGSMVGSAIVSPVLIDAPMVWRLLVSGSIYWAFAYRNLTLGTRDMFIFFISSGGFALRHREDINK
jgi:hypothetical protein